MHTLAMSVGVHADQLPAASVRFVSGLLRDVFQKSGLCLFSLSRICLPVH